MSKTKLSIIAAVAGVALALRASTGMADTITVHDLTENTSTETFTYAVQLDAAADVHGGDGFVIYDFPALASWSITGGLSSSQFTLVQTLTSNVLTTPSSVDANGQVAALSNGLSFDNPAVDNLSFVYNGPPTPFLGATLATLTLTSNGTGLHGIADTVYASVDHSGSSAAHPFSYSANPVEVPGPGNVTPLPAASIGGAGLMGLLALGRLFKARRIEA